MDCVHTPMQDYMQCKLDPFIAQEKGSSVYIYTSKPYVKTCSTYSTTTEHLPLPVDNPGQRRAGEPGAYHEALHL